MEDLESRLRSKIKFKNLDLVPADSTEDLASYVFKPLEAQGIKDVVSSPTYTKLISEFLSPSHMAQLIAGCWQDEADDLPCADTQLDCHIDLRVPGVISWMWTLANLSAKPEWRKLRVMPHPEGSYSNPTMNTMETELIPSIIFDHPESHLMTDIYSQSLCRIPNDHTGAFTDFVQEFLQAEGIEGLTFGDCYSKLRSEFVTPSTLSQAIAEHWIDSKETFPSGTGLLYCFVDTRFTEWVTWMWVAGKPLRLIED